MDPQLQDRPYLPACLAFELLEWIEIPRIDHERLFADDVRTVPQCEADVSVV